MNDELDERGGAGIFVTRLGGTPRRIIGTEGDGVAEACPAFSPDGRLLAYGVVTQGQTENDVPMAEEVVMTELVIASITERGTLSPLHRIRGGEFGGVPPCPKWSPDGSAVAWLDATQLWVAPLEGPMTSFDLTPGRYEWLQEIAWTHDGAAIAVAITNQVLLVEVDDGVSRILMSARTEGGFTERFDSVAASPVPPMLAVAGGWWGYPDEDSGWSLADGFLRVIDPDGQVVLEETGQLLAQRPFGTGVPAWSPDGTRLAWGSDRGLQILDIETETLVAEDAGSWDTEDRSPITLSSSVRWSPDGTRLLFIGSALDRFALVSISVGGPPDPVVLSDWGWGLYAESGEDLTWQPKAP